jgi:hypothetical protein
LAIRELELIDVHGSIAAGDLVKAEWVVQMMVADAAVDQRKRLVLEPALPAFVRRYDSHVGNELESVQSNRDSDRVSHLPTSGASNGGARSFVPPPYG